jgi:hypothetical protein
MKTEMLWWLLSVSVNWSWFMVLLNCFILRLKVGRVSCKETWSKVWLEQLMLHKAGLGQVRLLHCGLFRLLIYVSIGLMWMEWAKEGATHFLPCSIIYISWFTMLNSSGCEGKYFNPCWQLLFWTVLSHKVTV